VHWIYKVGRGRFRLCYLWGKRFFPGVSEHTPNKCWWSFLSASYFPPRRDWGCRPVVRRASDFPGLSVFGMTVGALGANVVHIIRVTKDMCFPFQDFRLLHRETNHAGMPHICVQLYGVLLDFRQKLTIQNVILTLTRKTCITVNEKFTPIHFRKQFKHKTWMTISNLQIYARVEHISLDSSSRNFVLNIKPSS
jgi:hypothetical protein